MEWLHQNCCSSLRSPLQNIDWKVVFPFGIWNIWLHRNAMVFNDGRTRGSVRANTISQVMEFAFLSSNEKSATSHNNIQVKWTKPLTNWYKDNSDGSSLGNPSLARGGLIRDETGKWIRGYARAIGKTTSAAAELWALHDGIRLCIALKLQAVVFELDAKAIVDLLKKDDQACNSNDNLVVDCKKGLREIPMVVIQHCYREANRCADAFAR